MAAAIETIEAYTTRSGDVQRQPDAALSKLETTELRWFFMGVESSFGVCSNYSAMEHELQRRSPSEDALREYHEEKRLRSRLRRRKTKPNSFSLINLALAVLGMQQEADNDPRSIDAQIPEWGREFMRTKSDQVVPNAQEHLASDYILAVVRQANHVRSRLIAVGSNWRGVLYAAYGPAARQAEIDATGFQDHPANLLGNPSLVAIAIACLEFARGPHDPSGWEQLWAMGRAHQVVTSRSNTKGSTIVNAVRHQAEDLLRNAAEAYKQTRCEKIVGVRPCKKCWG